MRRCAPLGQRRALCGSGLGLHSVLRSALITIFARLVRQCPGRAAVFQHPALHSTNYSELAARNALLKMRGLLQPRG